MRTLIGDKLSLFSYYTAMLNAITSLLVDGKLLSNFIDVDADLLPERPSQKTLHTMLLVAVNRVGGLDALFGLCREFITTIDMISEISVEERSEVTKQELSHAFNGLKVALALLQPIVSARPLFDSTQTPLAITTDKKDTDTDYFEPHNFLVRMRHVVLPLIRTIWEASWLASAPIGVSKLAVHIVMELLNAENEEVKDVQTSASILGGGGIGIPRMPPIVGPDENRIRQLMDMGFPRSAAERALMRTRNNVNAATELLLAHPYPFPPDPDPPAAEAQPAAGEGEGVAGEGDPQPAASGEGSPASSDNEAAPGPSTEEQPPAPPGKSAEEWVKELSTAREPLKQDIGSRILALVDEHPSLVFDVQKVFVGPISDYRTQAVKSLIDDIQAFSPFAYDVQEQPLSVRCHLLALVLGEPSSPAAQMPEKEAESLMNVLLSLHLSNPAENGHPVIPKWLSAQLLVVESLLVMGDSPRSVTLPKENEPIVRESIAQGPRYTEARNTLFDFCMRLLAVPTLPKDELISVLRLIVLLTRDPSIADNLVKRNGVGLLFQYLRVSSGTQSGAGIQSYIAIIVRHVVENQSTLQSVMRQEVKRFFSHPRTRMVDIGTFVSGCNSTALRDPEAFVKVTEDLCQLSQPYGSMKTISLRPETSSTTPQPSGASGEAQDKGNEMQVDEPSVAAVPSAPAESTEALIYYLIGELMKTVRSDVLPDGISINASNADATKSPDVIPPLGETLSEHPQAATEPKPPQDPVDYTYPCFIMQVLTELLFSYESCKIAFLSYTPKKRTQTPAKDSGFKHRTAAIQFLLSDLMTFGTINPQPPTEARKQITLCNWAMSVIVALCVDTNSGQDIKDVPSDLISVRKFVLEAINRALKDLPSSDNPETRYSRLLALADLCHRLLTVRFNVNGKKTSDEVPTHVAKVMLEKNFVATLTNVLAEVDLNYPNIRNVVSSVLRPLEHLCVRSSLPLHYTLTRLLCSTKIAMKMSRVSDKNKELVEEKPDTSESDMSEEDEDGEDETENPENDEASHVYRNSSLGLCVCHYISDTYHPFN